MSWSDSTTKTDFDVIIIGAGISGINFAYRLQERCPHLSYCILEQRHELGGTWSLFKYPGIRSDSDLHTFGFAWRPWTSPKSIAKSELITSYLQESAALYGIDKKIRYSQRVNAAHYSSQTTTWTLEVQNGEKVQSLTSHWTLFGTGYYDYDSPLKADIPHVDDFAGPVIHPQFWPEDLDYADKTVTVIGSGATAVTLLPAMAEKAKHVTMLQRSPTYIVTVPQKDKLEKMIRSYTPTFLHGLLVRWKHILMGIWIVHLSARYPKAIKTRLTDASRSQLPENVPVDPHFTPSYNPWEQRLCASPDGDFYAAIRSGKGSIETGIIKTVTKTGITLESGREIPSDIIITATGLRMSFLGNIKVDVDGKKFDQAGALTWKGAMLEGLPNAALMLGYADASWTLGADASAIMLTRMFNQMRREHVAQVVPQASPQEKEQIHELPLLRLNSSYVRKANQTIPVAGDRGPWKPRTHFVRDYLIATYGNLKTSMVWT